MGDAVTTHPLGPIGSDHQISAKYSISKLAKLWYDGFIEVTYTNDQHCPVFHDIGDLQLYKDASRIYFMNMLP